MADSFSVRFNRILDDYAKEVQDEARQVIGQVANETVQRLKKTSPKSDANGGNHYANGWRLKKNRNSAIVYNATKPGLTHLLEEQHPVANQYGSYGVSTPQKHIEPAEKWAIAEIDRRIEEVLDQ